MYQCYGFQRSAILYSGTKAAISIMKTLFCSIKCLHQQHVVSNKTLHFCCSILCYSYKSGGERYFLYNVLRVTSVALNFKIRIRLEVFLLIRTLC
jgi:hypothetical protein